MANMLSLVRFVANEKWRKDFGTDSLPQTFNYKEKPEVFKYYPQYYHKTDKVGPPCPRPPLILTYPPGRPPRLH